MEDNSLQRFKDAQENDFQQALMEITGGRKTGHWMWYIFPQITGLGFSETSRYYAIRDMGEAQAYLKDKILGNRLIQIAEALLGVEGKTAYQILGSPDDLKLKSCMTLFQALPEAPPVFGKVLIKYFEGKRDMKTLDILQSIGS
jgi:uncharacterized protein (DUF1810 family)